MNWKEIKDKCPKSWGKILEWKNYIEINEAVTSEYYNTLGWYFTDGIHSVQMWRRCELRNLFDFFDENNIIIYIMSSNAIFSHYINDRFCVKINNLWIEDLTNFDPYRSNNPETFDTRQKSETSAFTKAFEILESKL